MIPAKVCSYSFFSVGHKNGNKIRILRRPAISRTRPTDKYLQFKILCFLSIFFSFWALWVLSETLTKFSTETRVIYPPFFLPLQPPPTPLIPRNRRKNEREKKYKKKKTRKMGTAWGPMEYGHYLPFLSLSTVLLPCIIYYTSVVLFLRTGPFRVYLYDSFELLRILQKEKGKKQKK